MLSNLEANIPFIIWFMYLVKFPRVALSNSNMLMLEKTIEAARRAAVSKDTNRDR